MLSRIENVKGLGLLHDANGKAYKLESRALIFAGNGRGKSTLASILRSCAAGDPTILEPRVTIDGTEAPHVVFQFNAGHKVQFQQGSWSETRPEILVYDADFVERNVHSGTEITPEHRKNLLDFALGDRAVQAKNAEETASTKQQEATASIRRLSALLEAQTRGISLPVFRALKPVADADAKRTALTDRLSAANRANSILMQPIPDTVAIPDADIAGLFETLSRTLSDIHHDAEAAVDKHVMTVGEPRVTGWLREGQQFDNHETCPYCGQGTDGVPLIQMYQSFFNTAYGDLVSAVRTAAQKANFLTDPSRFEDFTRLRAAVNERSAQWSAYVDVNVIGAENDELAATTLGNLRELLASLFARKTLAVTEAVGTVADAEEASRLWDQYRQVLLEANELVMDSRTKVAHYKESLAGEDVTKIKQEISDLDAAVARHSESIVALIEELTDGETKLKDAAKAKKSARDTLTAQMTTTLTQYRADINAHLKNLGALFSIDEIKTNFMGSSPRTDYAISLRNKQVKLTGGIPSFATALSEGDKRTMAFAFFVASTLADPDIGNKVVVVDDPMSSLDRSRREHTTELLLSIARQCSQLIVLAHDAVYLRDLRKAMTRQDKLRPVSTVQISRTVGDYSNFAQVDLDRECESEYYSNYRTVDDFVRGTATDAREAAKAMRPLLEGYLHRRYPGHIATDLMLGSAIDQIKSAPTTSPLAFAQTKVPEMQSLNDFAGKFHHDTNPDYATVRADEQSVLAYGKRVLHLIHGGK